MSHLLLKRVFRAIALGNLQEDVGHVQGLRVPGLLRPEPCCISLTRFILLLLLPVWQPEAFTILGFVLPMTSDVRDQRR